MSDERFAVAKRFFDLWFSGVIDDPAHEGHMVLVWSAPLRASYFEPTAEAAAMRAVSLADQDQNVYFGVCSTSKPPKRGRGQESCITCVPGLWADIDIQSGPGIHKKNVAPNEAAAREVLASLDPSSILNHSGHGLQAYWKLAEPIWTASDEDRDRIKQVVRGWERTIRAFANKAGWTIDYTHDLTRVFRVPGMSNLKAEPVPVRILEPAEGLQTIRYTLDQIAKNTIPEQLTPEAQTSKVVVYQNVDYDVKLSSDAQFPDVVAFLSKNDTTFRRTLEKRRTDFTEDDSQSRYDFEVVRLMGIAGCTQQDIWDTLYAWRSMNGIDPDKMFRRTYWMPTIARGLAAAKQDLAEKKMDELIESVSNPSEVEPERQPDVRVEQQTSGRTHVSGEAQVVEEEGVVEHSTEEVPASNGEKPLSVKHITDEMRAQCCESVSNAIKLKILRVVQQGVDDAVYSIVLGNGADVRIGSSRQLHNQEHVYDRINEAAKVTFTAVSAKLWKKQADGMVKFSTPAYDPEKDRGSSIVDWLSLYCGKNFKKVLERSDEWREQVALGYPFICAGEMYVVNAKFMGWVNRERLGGELVKKRDFDDRMRVAGFVCCVKPMFGSKRGKRVGRRYWHCTVDCLPFLDGIASELEVKGGPGRKDERRVLRGPWKEDEGGRPEDRGADRSLRGDLPDLGSSGLREDEFPGATGSHDSGQERGEA